MHHLRAKAALLLLGLTTAAMADSLAFSYATESARGGTLTTANSNRTISRLITVGAKDVTVSALGLMATDGTQAATPVGIYNATTGVLVASATVAPTDPAIGLYYFKSISPVILSKNTNYYVASYVPNGAKYYSGVNAATMGSGLSDQTSTLVASNQLSYPSGAPSSTRTYSANFVYDVTRTVSSLSGLPTEMAPTYRGRWGVDPVSKLSSTTLSVTVTDSSNLALVGVPVTFEVIGDLTTAGRTIGGIAYPWLGANDDAGRPLGDAVGGAALGGSALTSTTVTTNASGVASVTFTAPEVAGTFQVRAVTANQANTSLWNSVDVKVPGLQVIPNSPSGSYINYTVLNDHQGNHSTVALAEALETASLLYVQYQRDETKGLPSLMRDLAAAGYKGKFWAASVPVRVGDASLPWGGMFDINGSLTTATGHSLHRDGNEVDIFVMPTLQKLQVKHYPSPDRLKITDANYEPTATVAQNTIIRQANLVRGRLLIQAFLDAGFELTNFGQSDGLRLVLHARLK